MDSQSAADRNALADQIEREGIDLRGVWHPAETVKQMIVQALRAMPDGAQGAMQEGVIERCMDMLADVPGTSLEDKLTHYIGSYMALQLQVQESSPVSEGSRGLVLVPREPTVEMLVAGCKALEAAKQEMMGAHLSGEPHAIARTKMKMRWDAMLAAAPEASQLPSTVLGSVE